MCFWGGVQFKDKIAFEIFVKLFFAFGIEGFDQAHSTWQEIPKQPIVVPTWVSLTLIKFFMKISNFF